MERRQLEHFLAVIDSASFTGAARKLFMAQPSLSHSIKKLESDLGVGLFHRTHRGVRLTPAGEVFEESARQILRDIQTARASVQNVAGLLSGRLDLATIPALVRAPLSGPIGLFRQQYQNVKIVLEQPERSHEVMLLVRAGESELGFIDNALPEWLQSELELSELGHQEMLVTLPPLVEHHGDSVTMEELFALPLVTGFVGTTIRDYLVETAEAVGTEPNIAVEVGRRESTLGLVIDGAGCAVLPEPLARAAEQDGAVVKRMEPRFLRTLRLIHRRGPLSPSATQFKELVLAVTGGAETSQDSLV